MSGKRQRFPVADLQLHAAVAVVGGDPVQLEILAREIDGRLGQVDAGDARAALREAEQVDADAAADLEDGAVFVAVLEIDDPRQVVQFVEAVIVQIVEEFPRADGVAGHFEIVDVFVPVALNRVNHRVSVGPPPRPRGRFHSICSSLDAAFAVSSKPQLVRYYPVRRDLRRLADEAYDLLIIGAGVYGAAMAWDAAQRGLKVALVDRGDIGAGTSFNNAKTVHGGIRSLQHGQFREMREYLRERRALARIAPHLVHPLPFLLPTYGKLTRHKLPLRAYFAMYDLLTSDRNEGVDPARHLPASELISREECLRRHPALDPAGVTGGIVWHDCQMYSGDRVTLAYARIGGARRRGGRELRRGGHAADWQGRQCVRRGGAGGSGDSVIGATLRDTLTGETFDVRAALTVNATGPYSSELLSSLAAVRAVPAVVPALSVAMNVVVRPIARDCAVGGSAQGRLFFLAPWRDVTIGGTSHEPYRGTASALRVTAAEVTRLLDDLNVAFPARGLDWMMSGCCIADCCRRTPTARARAWRC